MENVDVTLLIDSNEFRKNFIKIDDEKILNVNYIRWIQKKDECFYICSKMDGCTIIEGSVRVCKTTNSESFHKIMKMFYK
jgi:hypothetical protein